MDPITRQTDEVAPIKSTIRQAVEALREMSQDPKVLELLQFRDEVERARAAWCDDARWEGQLELLAQQLESKFGGSRDEHRSRLARLPSERLSVIAVRLLTADSLDDLWLGR